jgi:ubiquinol-cytochrome c reductase cytochrome c subunit
VPAAPSAERVALAGAAQVQGGDGAALYAANCSACHGASGEGSGNGPNIQNAGAAGADFMIRTGRMPLPAPDAPVRRGRSIFSEEEIEALVAYVASLGDGPDIPAVDVTDGTDIANGRADYIANCAACHGAGGSGDAVGGGAIAPNLLGTGPTQVGEAIRLGPGAMPAFDEQQVSDQGLSDIAAYLEFLRTGESAPGGARIGGVGPVAEGYVGWLVYLVALVGVTRWIERRRSR